MKIKYNFSLSQEWNKDGLIFTECVCERHNLDMIQLMDIFDDLTLFTSRDKADNKEIISWLAQNEQVFVRCGKVCVDDRTVVLYANLSYYHYMNDKEREVANKYSVGFDDENQYTIRAKIMPVITEE